MRKGENCILGDRESLEVVSRLFVRKRLVVTAEYWGALVGVGEGVFICEGNLGDIILGLASGER